MKPGGIQSNIKAKQITCSIVVRRADGTVEDLGVVAYQHKNPLKTLAWQLRRWWKKAGEGIQ